MHESVHSKVWTDEEDRQYILTLPLTFNLHQTLDIESLKVATFCIKSMLPDLELELGTANLLGFR